MQFYFHMATTAVRSLCLGGRASGPSGVTHMLICTDGIHLSLFYNMINGSQIIINRLRFARQWRRRVELRFFLLLPGRIREKKPSDIVVSELQNNPRHDDPAEERLKATKNQIQTPTLGLREERNKQYLCFFSRAHQQPPTASKPTNPHLKFSHDFFHIHGDLDKLNTAE